MLTLGLFARLEAKPGKEQEVSAFLKQGLTLANQEATTPLWFALQLAPTTFAIFDAFHDEAGRQSHLKGPIAQMLMQQAPNLLATPPVIERMEVLGAKLSQPIKEVDISVRQFQPQDPMLMWRLLEIECQNDVQLSGAMRGTRSQFGCGMQD